MADINFLQLIQDAKLQDLLFTGQFGLEKENARVDSSGHLALSPHPKEFGNKGDIENQITTDFAESQVEIITKAHGSIEGALTELEILNTYVAGVLSKHNETLWRYSMPPILPDDSLIKCAQFDDQTINDYREYLANKYGKRKQLICGVHYNFSFGNEFMHQMYNYLNKSDYPFACCRDFKDYVYLKIARFCLKYTWIIVYLFGASSITHSSFWNEDNNLFIIDSDALSIRNGPHGYRNLHEFYVDYNSLNGYVQSINQAIDNKILASPKEYYAPVRFKIDRNSVCAHSPKRVISSQFANSTIDNALSGLLTDGVDYIEIRALDLNPLAKNEVSELSLKFIHMLLVYALLSENCHFSVEEYKNANYNKLHIAMHGRHQDIEILDKNVKHKALNTIVNLLIDIENTIKNIPNSSEYLDVLSKIKKMTIQSTFTAQMVEKSAQTTGYVNYFTDHH